MYKDNTKLAALSKDYHAMKSAAQHSLGSKNPPFALVFLMNRTTNGGKIKKVLVYFLCIN